MGHFATGSFALSIVRLSLRTNAYDIFHVVPNYASLMWDIYSNFPTLLSNLNVVFVCTIFLRVRGG